MEILQSKKTKVVIVVILLIVFLFCIKSCHDQTKTTPKVLNSREYQARVAQLVETQRNIQKDWNRLIDEVAFKDLCNEVYSQRFYKVGQECKDTYQAFMDIEVEGDKESMLFNYPQYVTYFTLYKEIGKQLQDLSKVLKESNYQVAITHIKELRTLIKSIPILE